MGGVTAHNMHYSSDEFTGFPTNGIGDPYRGVPNKPGDKYGVGGKLDPAIHGGFYNLSEVDTIWPRLRVMARCQPEHKLILVSAMMESQLHTFGNAVRDLEKDHIHIAPEGQVVAVTGDGTNDAPSLKQSDVGFAMGIAGTEVSKNACDIILMDDNFSSIVTALKWGRNVYDSVAKFLQFQLTVNIVAIIVASIGAVVYQKSPLGAIQMLWVNLIMDSLGSLALATEPPVDSLLERKPYGKSKSMLSTEMCFNLFGQSVYQLTVVLYIMFMGEYLFFHEDALDKAYLNGHNSTGGYHDYIKIGRIAECEYTQHYTCLFNTFVMMTLFNQIAARKLLNEFNLFSGIFNNVYFLVIVGLEGAMQVGFIQLLGKAVGCYKDGLSPYQWGICIAFGVGTWIWQEVVNVAALFVMPSLKAREAQILKEHGPQESRMMKAMKSVSQIPVASTILSDRVDSRLDLEHLPTSATDPK